ncbi:MAG: type III-A CRISPR-associated RAMP protein Csm3 [Chloroflexi bacterium]|nr:type III-A CRISPR-associated RAMP protein Csm3 [Chloroflexota bacterium]
MSERKIKLEKRVFITFDIEAVTGLHIGGSDVKTEIGGVDKTVVRDPLTDRPYIPGSSLKGKMRSLLEKYNNKEINFPPNKPAFHVCQDGTKYADCDICQVFGVSGEKEFATPTRLVVRDSFLSWKSVVDLQKAQTDLPYTEVKTEVSIDRVTSAANPRQMERVPAGVIFGGKDEEGKDQPTELVYSVYSGTNCDAQKDADRLGVIIEGLKLLEDDYLGGLGSRGSGKVRFNGFKVKVLALDPEKGIREIKDFSYSTINDFSTNLTEVQGALK